MRQDIKYILNSIVKRWPEEPRRVNTFVVIDDGTEFETENLNASYDDFLRGEFWSRDWVLSGAHPDRLRKQYPILSLEHKQMYTTDVFNDRVCYEFWMVLVDTVDKDESFYEVDTRLFEAVFIIFQQLKEFIFVEKNGETYWTIKELKTDDEKLVKSLENMIEVRQVDVRSAEVALTDNARAVSFSITLCDCAPTQDGFVFEVSEPEKIGITKCKVC